MAKSSVICEACGENNPPSSEFCVGCGSKLPSISIKEKTESVDDTESKYLAERERSISNPFLYCLLSLYS